MDFSFNKKTTAGAKHRLYSMKTFIFENNAGVENSLHGIKTNGVDICVVENRFDVCVVVANG